MYVCIGCLLCACVYRCLLCACVIGCLLCACVIGCLLCACVYTDSTGACCVLGDFPCLNAVSSFEQHKQTRTSELIGVVFVAAGWCQLRRLIHIGTQSHLCSSRASASTYVPGGCRLRPDTRHATALHAETIKLDLNGIYL